MNIKKIIKISFMIMLFIVLVIGIINTIIIYQWNDPEKVDKN